jgi:hypothetical protein
LNEGDNELPDLLPEREKHRPLWVRVLCVAGAVALFAAGVVGWLTPVVTGIPFYIGGVVLLAVASERARVWVNGMERRFPRGLRLKLRQGMRRIPIKSIQNMAASPPERGAREEKVQGGV